MKVRPYLQRNDTTMSGEYLQSRLRWAELLSLASLAMARNEGHGCLDDFCRLRICRHNPGSDHWVSRYCYRSRFEGSVTASQDDINALNDLHPDANVVNECNRHVSTTGSRSGSLALGGLNSVFGFHIGLLDSRFSYYWCRRPGCRAIRVRGEELEALK